MRWSQAQPQGRLRKPCEGHTISVVDRTVYVLFGKHEDDHGNPICPPMQLLDTESMTLSSPTVEAGVDGRHNVPDDREGHTASVIGKRIFIFAGTWTGGTGNGWGSNSLASWATLLEVGKRNYNWQADVKWMGAWNAELSASQLAQVSDPARSATEVTALHAPIWFQDYTCAAPVG